VLMWAESEMDDYLHEFLRLDGRGDAGNQNHCVNCELGDPVYRCEDCFGSVLYCRDCIVALHKCNPLHRIEVRYFSISLYVFDDT
jgi:hypothetical protein